MGILHTLTGQTPAELVLWASDVFWGRLHRPVLKSDALVAAEALGEGRSFFSRVSLLCPWYFRAVPWKH